MNTKKLVIYTIRASNDIPPSLNDIFATTHSEFEAKKLLIDAQMQYDYADVLINEHRYSKIC